MRMNRLLALAATTAVAALAPAGAAMAKDTITMSGSTSVAPLASALAKGYLKDKGRKAAFRLLQGGSDVGIADVSKGRVTIGNSSRDPLPSDPGGLVFNRIARDGICVATNPKNPLSDLSQDAIQAIFSGQVRNWSDVPGAKVSGSINLITRTAASGTQDAFQNIFLGQSLKIAPSASTKSSNGLVQQTIKSDPNAIGYVDFSFTEGVATVPYKGVACDLRNAKSGQYEGVRNFWMVTRGAAKGGAKAWLSWIRSSGKAKAIISKNWVPLR